MKVISAAIISSLFVAVVIVGLSQFSRATAFGTPRDYIIWHPVQLPAKFVMAINLKTAKELGLDVPLLMQQRADELIE